MAGEYLHDELNSENDEKCIAWKRLEQKKKQSASRSKKQPTLLPKANSRKLNS